MSIVTGNNIMNSEQILLEKMNSIPLELNPLVKSNRILEWEKCEYRIPPFSIDLNMGG